MSDPLIIPANERGVVRLFALNLRPAEARFLQNPGAAAQALGVDGLDQAQVEVFPVSDLDELGLPGYLSEGFGIPDDQIDTDRLSDQTGWVLILRSAAFGGKPARLSPDPALTLVGTYNEPGTDWSGGELAADSAAPYSAPRLPPRAVRVKARWIGGLLVGFFMILIFGGLLWLIL